MRTITLEEHFATPGFLDGPGRELKDQAERYNSSRAVKLIEQLCDIGDKRLAEMDAAGIDMQVLSLTSPGTEQLATAEAIVLANETNDYLADAIKKIPPVLAGSLRCRPPPPTRPHENWSTGSAAEIRRRRHQRTQSRTLSGRQVLLADPGMCGKTWRPDLFASDTAAGSGDRSLIRRVCAPGHANARRPRLGLAYRNRRPCHPPYPRRRLRPLSEIADRDRPHGRRAAVHVPGGMPRAVTKLERPISAYLRENVHYTFSGFNFPPAFLDLLLELGGVERIMFSANHPYQSMVQARAFLSDSRSAPPTRSGSPTATRSGCSGCNGRRETVET